MYNSYFLKLGPRKEDWTEFPLPDSEFSDYEIAQQCIRHKVPMKK